MTILDKIINAIKAEDYDGGVIWMSEEDGWTVLDTEDFCVATQIIYDTSQILYNESIPRGHKFEMTIRSTQTKHIIKFRYGYE